MQFEVLIGGILDRWIGSIYCGVIGQILAALIGSKSSVLEQMALTSPPMHVHRQ